MGVLIPDKIDTVSPQKYSSRSSDPRHDDFLLLRSLVTEGKGKIDGELLQRELVVFNLHIISHSSTIDLAS